MSTTKTTKVTRDTIGELFSATMKAAREAGELARMDGIKDYDSADFHEVQITNYGFDVYFYAMPGNSEGIYIDGFIDGLVDNSGVRKRLHIGTIKTLYESLEAMKIMGEACGVLTYFASQYINKNLDRYEPDR